MPTGQDNDYFGTSVALEKGRLVVGAYGRDIGTSEDQGAAYSYHFANGAWVLDTPADPLSASDGFAGDHLGYAVALSGDRALYWRPATVQAFLLRGQRHRYRRPGLCLPARRVGAPGNHCDRGPD